MKVRLIDGPFEGAEVEMADPRSGLQLTGDEVPDGTVASYRPTRTRGEMRFKGYANVIACLPLPGAAA